MTLPEPTPLQKLPDAQQATRARLRTLERLLRLLEQCTAIDPSGRPRALTREVATNLATTVADLRIEMIALLAETQEQRTN